MSQTTKIEWADCTFNPWIGCTKVSPACDNCYAEAQMDKRLHKVNWGAGQPRVRTSPANWKLPTMWNELAEKGKFVRCSKCGTREFRRTDIFCSTKGCMSFPECDNNPSRPRVFCSSLADVFDNEVDQHWRKDLWHLFESTPHLDWLVLTKRISNAKKMVPSRWLSHEWPPHVWLGITVCNQAEAERDIPKLLSLPASTRFLSIEPMLGPIDLTTIERTQSPGYFGDCLQWYHQPHGERYTKWNGIDWVICGGESGSNARPSHPDWVRKLRDDCAAAGVPFLFKQWGEWAPAKEGRSVLGKTLTIQGIAPFTDKPKWTQFEDGQQMARIGTKSAGRSIDGHVWNEFPG